jgi:choline-sulfatase
MGNNVVVLIADQHNPFFCSAYGHPYIHTPNLQALANEGTVADSVYCPSPLCAASRAAYFSGKRVHEIQAYSTCFFKNNYNGPIFGKFLRDQNIPFIVGIDDSYEMGLSENRTFRDLHPSDSVRALTPPRDKFFDPDSNKGMLKNLGLQETPDAKAEHDQRWVDSTCEWIRKNAKKEKSPWFLQVCIKKPHPPFVTTPQYWNLYEGLIKATDSFANAPIAHHPFVNDIRDFTGMNDVTQEQALAILRAYLGSLSYVDELLGQIRKALQDAGLDQNTNLLYTSDHGEMMGSFGLWGKCILLENAIRVPFIAAGPDFSSGKRFKTPIDLHDVRATIFECLGAKQPPDWLGTPIQKLSDRDYSRIVFSEYHGQGCHNSSYMIRKGKWKYIHFVNAPKALFNLEEDLGELHNLADQKPDIVKDLESELRKICDPEKEDQRAADFIRMQNEQAKSLIPRSSD